MLIKVGGGGGGGEVYLQSTPFICMSQITNNAGKKTLKNNFRRKYMISVTIQIKTIEQCFPLVLFSSLFSLRTGSPKLPWEACSQAIACCACFTLGGGGGSVEGGFNFLLHSLVVNLRTVRKTDTTFNLTMPLFEENSTLAL